MRRRPLWRGSQGPRSCRLGPAPKSSCKGAQDEEHAKSSCRRAHVGEPLRATREELTQKSSCLRAHIGRGRARELMLKGLCAEPISSASRQADAEEHRQELTKSSNMRAQAEERIPESSGRAHARDLTLKSSCKGAHVEKDLQEIWC